MGPCFFDEAGALFACDESILLRLRRRCFGEGSLTLLGIVAIP